MKKLLALTLALVMLFSALPALNAIQPIELCLRVELYST